MNAFPGKTWLLIFHFMSMATTTTKKYRNNFLEFGIIIDIVHELAVIKIANFKAENFCVCMCVLVFIKGLFDDVPWHTIVPTFIFSLL